MCRGGGKAWLKDQEDIYHHAKGLGIIDVPHPWGDDRKQGTEDDLTKSQWRNFTDRLNAAKAKATADGTQHFVLGSTDEQNQRSSDWYQTPEGAAYAASIGKPVGFGIRDGGGDGGATVAVKEPGRWIIDDYLPPVGIGPYPADNMYFPQLTHAYETPQAQDWSQYGLLDPNYQPWSVQGGQQFVPENIWNYAPPQINRQPVQYAGPPMGGLMEVEQYSGPSDPEEKPMTEQEKIESGLFDGVPGYGEGGGYGANPFSGAGKYGPGGMYGHAAVPTGPTSEGYGTLGDLFGVASGEDDNSSSEFGPESEEI